MVIQDALLEFNTEYLLLQFLGDFTKNPGHHFQEKHHSIYIWKIGDVAS